MYNKVLVTGGTGFVGRRLKLIRPDWIYISSSDCDLTDKEELFKFLSDLKPDAIIHLAARVGGIKDSVENQSEFFYLNSLINLNIIHESFNAGVKRVLSCLSTCCFPDVNDVYPMIEEDILKAEPTESNYCYAYAKRSLFIQSKWYSKQYKICYNTFTPSNIYGPNNNFNADKSHFISNMIRKFYQANDGDTLTFWGTGNSLRQHLYVDDLANIIALIIDKHTTDLPLIIAPDENISIKEIVLICKKITKKDVNICFDGNLTGQYRKDCSNEKLLDIIGDYKFKSLEDGLRGTYKWYKNYRLKNLL